MSDAFSCSDIISCQHCQIFEEGKIVWGCGRPVYLGDVFQACIGVKCPNCTSPLNEFDIVLINLEWTQKSNALQSKAGGF